MLEIKIGIAGTAKNTGKTTTTASVVDELRARGISFFLTSIGYDGENIDNITGLPKPKLRVQTGDIIATAERCIKVSTADMRVIQETDIRTPLGKVFVCKVVTPGLAVTAGPNKSSEVQQLSQILRQIGPGVTIFDGALNRIAPMAETDAIILSTGAAKTPMITTLSKETELIWRITNIPKILRAAELADYALSNVTLLDSNLQIISMIPHSSLLSESHAENLLMQAAEGSFLFIPGIINERVLNSMVTWFQVNRFRVNVVFSNPIKLLVAGNPVVFDNLFDKMRDAGAFIGVLKQIPLLAITINPFYPEFRFESKTYKPAYVDFRHLQVSVQRHVDVPVFNIIRQGPTKLVDIILANARYWSAGNEVRF